MDWLTDIWLTVGYIHLSDSFNQCSYLWKDKIIPYSLIGYHDGHHIHLKALGQFL